MVAFFLFLVACLLAIQFSRLVPLGFKWSLIGSFLYHLIFGGYYWYYSLSNPADSFRYFLDARSGKMTYALGTDFIGYITSWYVIPLNANYYSTMLLYSFVGMFGLWMVYVAVLENMVSQPQKLTRLLTYSILFIPGLNFWTSALGKDSLIMLGIGLLLFSLSRFDHRKLFFCLSLVLIFHIRPHVAFVIAIALGLAIIFDRKSFGLGKMGILLMLGTVSILTAPVVTEYVGLSEVNENSVEAYVEERQDSNLMGGSSVDISQYNVAGQILTYLYRPLFIDANNILGLIVSMENLYYIFVTFLLIKLVRGIPIKKIAKVSTLFIKFSFLYGAFMILILSITTANMGIAIRQKTMFIVCLLALAAIYSSYQDYLNRKYIRNRVNRG